ncbi:MAG: cysteine desulfurase [Candidatus Nanoarchaeia archaeon]|jgi:cysteine desulfurase/selenocysteine lyase|nr:cysteine desulfurase [Candidatus Nanoarchaeia archaeon]|tara:strand:+ start:16812 stop:18038 length:1227 start_codon:yes stop_codon:yes gene_type:complete
MVAITKNKMEKLREDFPILSRKIHDKQLIYLDNSATTQKPIQVIDTIIDYYSNYNSNVHRGLHKLSEEATLKFEEAHKKVAKFINADFKEVIFTKGTTESLNLLAYSLSNQLKKGDEIVLTQMEHHSNLVPWQQIAKKLGLKLKFIKIKNDGTLDLENNPINKKTKIVSITHISNFLGTINPVKEIGKIAHENNALFIVDAAQSVPHLPIDVKDIDCDFLVFSAHKMLGPTGIGILYGKKDLLNEMQPFNYGGDMILEVKFEDAKFNELPWKFEAGTPNIAGAIGFGATIDYLNKVEMNNIREHGKELTKYAIKKLSEVKNLEVYGPLDPEKRGSLISFNLINIHPHDIVSLLDDHGIAVRGGHHCAMPTMKLMGLTGSVRASFYLYNTKEEIDYFVETLEKVKGVFK